MKRRRAGRRGADVLPLHRPPPDGVMPSPLLLAWKRGVARRASSKATDVAETPTEPTVADPSVIPFPVLRRGERQAP